jgi:hypothetical protein
MSRTLLLKLGGFTAIVAVGLVIAMGSAHVGSSPADAQEPATLDLSADGCTDDCFFDPGTDFTLSVSASGIPSTGYSAFQTEIFPDGVTYNMGTCEDEVLVEPAILCLGPTAGAWGATTIGATCGLGAIPYDTCEGDELVNQSYTCEPGGEHTFVLTAEGPPETASLLGSRLRDENGGVIAVLVRGNVDLDLNDTQGVRPIDYADILTITCGEPPTATPEEEPTDGAPTATPVPPAELPGTGTGASDGGFSAASWAIIIGLVLGAGALTGAGWRFSRSRAG